MKTIKKLKPARGRPAYSWPHIKSLIFTLKSLDLKHFIELVLKQMSGKMFHTGTTRLIKWYLKQLILVRDTASLKRLPRVAWTLETLKIKLSLRLHIEYWWIILKSWTISACRRRSSSLSKPNKRNLSSYDKIGKRHRMHTLRVKLRCTLSNKLISCSNHGFHTTLQYSKMGRT